MTWRRLAIAAVESTQAWTPSVFFTTPLHIARAHVHVEPLDSPPVGHGEGHSFRFAKHRGGLHCSASTRRYQRNIHSFNLAASNNCVALATAHYSNRFQSSSDRAYRQSHETSPTNTWWPRFGCERNRFLTPVGCPALLVSSRCGLTEPDRVGERVDDFHCGAAR